MKNFLLRAGAVVLVLIAVLLVAAFWSDSDKAVLSGYKQNENLPTVKPGWPGTPVDQKDRFMNVEHPFLPKISELLKWQLSGNPFKEEKKNDNWRPEVKDPAPFLRSGQDGILWLGHASFFIRLNGVSILIDPVFGDPAFISEYTSVPSPLEHIPAVDYVLISHDHRDHMDETTLTAIAEEFPNAKFLAGLRSEEILQGWAAPTNTINTAGWYQQFALPDERVKIFFVPVRHWSRRGLFDTNHRLWGGYVVQSDKATIYHGGDSGFGSHYREAGEVFPNIDYFLIGIGAYEPRWFMHPNHNTPEQAVQGFIDSGAKTLVPMHYGRFNMSDEPPSQPLRLFLQEVERRNLNARTKVLAINDNIVIE